MGVITIRVEGGDEIELMTWPVGPGDASILRILVEERGSVKTADNDASTLIDSETAKRLGKILLWWSERGRLPKGKEVWE